MRENYSPVTVGEINITFTGVERTEQTAAHSGNAPSAQSNARWEKLYKIPVIYAPFSHERKAKYFGLILQFGITLNTVTMIVIKVKNQ